MPTVHTHGITQYYETYGDPANPSVLLVGGLGGLGGVAEERTRQTATPRSNWPRMPQR